MSCRYCRRASERRDLPGGVQRDLGERAAPAGDHAGDRLGQAEVLAVELVERPGQTARQEGVEGVARRGYGRGRGGEQALVGREERRLDVDQVLAEHLRAAARLGPPIDQRLPDL